MAPARANSNSLLAPFDQGVDELDGGVVDGGDRLLPEHDRLPILPLRLALGGRKGSNPLLRGAASVRSVLTQKYAQA